MIKMRRHPRRSRALHLPRGARVRSGGGIAGSSRDGRARQDGSPRPLPVGYFLNPISFATERLKACSFCRKLLKSAKAEGSVTLATAEEIEELVREHMEKRFPEEVLKVG